MKNFKLRQNNSSWKNTDFLKEILTETYLFQCCFNEMLVGLGAILSSVLSFLLATKCLLMLMGTEGGVSGSNFQKIL